MAELTAVTDTTLFSPGLVLLLGGLLMAALPGRLQQAAAGLLPLITLYFIWEIPAVALQNGLEVFGYRLTPVRLHDYTRIFATVFALAAFAGGLFALNQNRRLELPAAYVYAGGAICVTFAGDWITFFIFWEIMAIASTLVVAAGGTAAARASALRYAAMHFLGGVFLMAGITAHVLASGAIGLENFSINMDTGYAASQTLLQDINLQILFTGLHEPVSTGYVETMRLESAGAWLILAGILVNVAAPPFSSWLPDSYPESSPSGMVFLSAFTTKTAVFALLVLFAGADILIFIGLFMAMYGIVYAILENDMRRILAYSIINQVGFMVTGIGIGTKLSMDGAAAHAFCHIIYKALLLMSAGSVLYMTGKRRCSDLGGLYHSMKLTCICGTIGALAISAFPLTSGFVSKSMISSAAAQEGLAVVWFLLAAASAGVFLHAGIKFPWFVFFQKDSGLRPPDPPRNMQWAMLLLAALCILPGIFPEYLYAMLPGEITYAPNTATHFVTQTQLLLFSGLAFFLMLPLLKRTRTISLDFDWTYRVFLRWVLESLEKLVALIGWRFAGLGHFLLRREKHQLQSMFCPEDGATRTVTVGDTALWIAALLACYLLLGYSL